MTKAIFNLEQLVENEGGFTLELRIDKNFDRASLDVGQDYEVTFEKPTPAPAPASTDATPVTPPVAQTPAPSADATPV